MQSINPATKEVIYEPKELTKAEIDAKLQKAHEAYKQWKDVPFAERAALMKKAAQYLRDNKVELAKLITDEMGKITTGAQAEIEKCAFACDYFADNVEKMLAEEAVSTDASESYVRFDPIGVIFAIMPWNFPFWQVLRFAPGTIMAGNTVALKHAGNVQLCAEAIEKMFREVGFPEGVFTTLTIDVPAVEGVIKDPRVAAVTLTGSERAGVAVATQAGEVLKKVVMELGGADPFIVLPDADLDFTAAQAVSGRIYMNAGQTCIAAKRFIVVESVYEEFLQKIKAGMEALVVGDPNDESTQLGPVCSERALTGMKEQIDKSVAMGARVVTGGGLGPDAGFYCQPTILTDLKPGMPAYDEEIFGPVMSVFVVKDEAEAIALANGTDFGLGASIFTTNVEHGKELAAQIEAGMVFINGVSKTDPRLPAGGIKRSGYGRELSHYGVKEFVNIKTVWIK